MNKGLKERTFYEKQAEQSEAKPGWGLLGFKQVLTWLKAHSTVPVQILDVNENKKTN